MTKVLHIQTKRYGDRLSYQHKQNDFNNWEMIEEIRSYNLWRGVIWGILFTMAVYLLAIVILTF